MTVAQRIEKVTRNYPKQATDKDGLKKLERFDDEMKRCGIIRPTTYGFPMPDTIGHRPKGECSTQWDISSAYGNLNMG